MLESNKRRLLDFTASQQFYDIDCVKQHLRGLQQTDTLYKRNLQIEHNQQHTESVYEKVRKEMKEQRGSQMKAIQQDWLNKKQLAMKRKAHAEEVRQWMKEKEQQRMQKKERLKETQEFEQMQQHETVQEELRQNQLQKQKEAVNSQLEHEELRPLDNTASQQLYQNDHVKRCPRGPMLTDTLMKRKVQIEHNQRHKDSAVEQARKDMVERQGSQMKATEPGRLNEEQRAMRRKAYTEELKQRMRKNEQRTAQKKIERLRNIQESKQQYELDKEELRKKPLLKHMEATDSRIENQKLKCRNTTLKDKQEEMNKGQQRNSVQEERWVRECKEKPEDWIRQRIRRSEVMGANMETQLREQAKKLEKIHSTSRAKALAEQEAQYRQEQNFTKRMLLDIKSSIAEHRDDKQKEHQLQAMEEQRSSQETLPASQEADRLFWEAQNLEDQRKRENRVMMDTKLCEQIAKKRAAEQLRKQRDIELDRKILELHALEDQQFESYVRDVIDTATDANMNVFPLRKYLQSGAGQGLGTSSGRIGANCLVTWH